MKRIVILVIAALVFLPGLTQANMLVRKHSGGGAPPSEYCMGYDGGEDAPCSLAGTPGTNVFIHGYTVFSKYTIPDNGVNNIVLKSMYAYFPAAAASYLPDEGEWKLGVYTDNGGQPGNLLVVTDPLGDVASTGWSGPHSLGDYESEINANDVLWLAIGAASDAGITAFGAINSDGTGVFRQNSVYFPNPASASSYYGSGKAGLVLLYSD